MNVNNNIKSHTYVNNTRESFYTKKTIPSAYTNQKWILHFHPNEMDRLLTRIADGSMLDTVS